MYQKHGFTLIELLVVVLIIGVLAAVALPQYQKAVLKSRLMKGYLWFNKLEDAQKVFYLANGRYAAFADELDLDFTTAANSSFTVDAWSAAHYVTIKDQRFRVSWEFNYDNTRGTYGKYCFFSPGLSNAKYIRQICQDLGGAYSHANSANEYFVFPNR